MSRRDNHLLILDMLDAAIKIRKYTSNMKYEEFLESDIVIDAVSRNFEIIGEAASRIDEKFKINYNQIEWLRITGFRNRIIHEYFGIDYEIMWAIVEDKIDELIEKLEEVLRTE